MLKLLGSIAPANGATKNNTNTAAPFAIPAGTTALMLLPSTTGMLAEVSYDLASGSTFAATTSSFPLPTTGLKVPTFPQVGGKATETHAVVAVWNASGGAASVSVFAMYK
jgi:hypothetical protein